MVVLHKKNLRRLSTVRESIKLQDLLLQNEELFAGCHYI